MSPIAWWNDDLPELSDDVTLEECLRQSRSAGFTGMEKGRRFPNDPATMLPILKAADVTLCGGWFSGTLVNEEMAANQDRILPMKLHSARFRREIPGVEFLVMPGIGHTPMWDAPGLIASLIAGHAQRATSDVAHRRGAQVP